MEVVERFGKGRSSTMEVGGDVKPRSIVTAAGLLNCNDSCYVSNGKVPLSLSDDVVVEQLEDEVLVICSKVA